MKKYQKILFNVLINFFLTYKAFCNNEHSVSLSWQSTYALISQNTGKGSFFSLVGSGINYAYKFNPTQSIGTRYYFTNAKNAVVMHGIDLHFLQTIFGNRPVFLSNDSDTVLFRPAFELEIGGSVSLHWYNFSVFGGGSQKVDKKYRSLSEGNAMGFGVLVRPSLTVSDSIRIFSAVQAAQLGTSEQSLAKIQFFNAWLGIEKLF
jgi:hypothetical protein